MGALLNKTKSINLNQGSSKNMINHMHMLPTHSIHTYIHTYTYIYILRQTDRERESERTLFRDLLHKTRDRWRDERRYLVGHTERETRDHQQMMERV